MCTVPRPSAERTPFPLPAFAMASSVLRTPTAAARSTAAHRDTHSRYSRTSLARYRIRILVRAEHSPRRVASRRVTSHSHSYSYSSSYSYQADMMYLYGMPCILPCWLTYLGVRPSVLETTTIEYQN